MCRRLGQAICGRPNCPTSRRPYPPGQHGRARRRETEFQLRLMEKQKLRAMYGVGERQFRRYFERASRRKGVTGEELLINLETRLDSLVLRLGFALTLRQARQLVTHGHVKVEGRRVDIPSAEVRPGQTIEVAERARNFVSVREALEVAPDPPPYLDRDREGATGVLTRRPYRGELPLPVPVDERLIVEYYS